ncbi:polysaccharide biosynthesis/export family protein [Dyella mobilis]|uniref:Polysaccharide biosynthesis/export family protein n=1 Tax=Dyella mobilis TaxID=1849582 RepID=A0ABS2KFA3_9GAMM|nr:polysaccharide biosynthesis/export family protein [Dyella mobilis]MBM7129834.1 polysaccharide biosynthesis/export family protein [Dyella mobilis]GLQ97902.1 capsular polysaccharide transporter [Dyella mobilis]
MIVRVLTCFAVDVRGGLSTARARRRFAPLAVLCLSGCALAPGMSAPVGEPPATLITPAVIAAQAIPADPDIDALLAAFATPSEEYRIGPADILAIGVVNHPELVPPDAPPERNGTDQPFGFVVDASGRLNYPHVGHVVAAGRTVEQVRSDLTGQLAQYIRDPQIAVRVIGFRSKRVYVDGAVHTAGSQDITDVPMTLALALAGAGGIPSNADASCITLTRGGKIHSISLGSLVRVGRGAENIYLRDGDRVHIAEQADKPVFVAGEVGQARAVPMRDGVLSLGDALALSGSVSQLGSNPRGVYVVRIAERSRTPEIFRLDAASPTGLALAGQFPLQPRDLVYVQTAGLMRWNRVMNLLLSSTLSLYNTQRAVDGP